MKSLPDKSFFTLVEHLIKETQKATALDDLRSLIACIGTVSYEETILYLSTRKVLADAFICTLPYQTQ